MHAYRMYLYFDTNYLISSAGHKHYRYAGWTIGSIPELEKIPEVYSFTSWTQLTCSW